MATCFAPSPISEVIPPGTDFWCLIKCFAFAGQWEPKAGYVTGADFDCDRSGTRLRVVRLPKAARLGHCTDWHHDYLVTAATGIR
jgi:hypothetical protein